MLRASAIAALLASGSAPALALPGVMAETLGSRACYLRAYDAKHLAANSAQRTTAIRVSFRVERIAGAIESVPPLSRIRIEATRRNVAQPLRAIGDCRFSEEANRDVQGATRIRSYPRAAGIVCSISQDATDEGGGAEPVISVSGETLTIHMDESLPMRRKRKLSDGESQMIDFSRNDAVFRLRRVADTDCDALDRAIVSE
jgi:hypothetical protein